MGRSTEVAGSCELREQKNSPSGQWCSDGSPWSLDAAQHAGFIMILETLPASAMKEPLAHNE